MKKYVISTIVILLTAFLVVSTFAQPASTGTTTGIARGVRAGRTGTGIRAGGNRNSEAQTQQTAIEEIEAQIAKLKTNLEAQAELRESVVDGAETVVTGTLSGRTPTGQTVITTMVETIDSPEETEKINKLLQERKALITAIEEQIIVLKGFQFQIDHENEMSELEEISSSATQENAAGTAKLLQDLIAKRRQAFQDTLEKLGIRQRGTRGQGQGRGIRAGQRRGQQ